MNTSSSEHKTADDFRIEEIEKVNLNGCNVKGFKVFIKQRDGAFVFRGGCSAPIKTANRNLWKIAASSLGIPIDDTEIEPPVTRLPGRPTEVQGGKTRRLYAGEDDWQWLIKLGNGEPSSGLRNARNALDPLLHQSYESK